MQAGLPAVRKFGELPASGKLQCDFRMPNITS